MRALIDSGSQRSYILQTSAQKLNLQKYGEEQVIHSLFGDKTTKPVNHKKYKINLGSVDGNFEILADVRECDNLCGKIPHISANSKSLHTELREHGVSLNDDKSKYEIELLIGADLYARIMIGKVINLKCGAAAIATKLGWTMLGNVGTSGSEDSVANLCLSMSVVDTSITQLWAPEALGITDPIENKTRENVENEARELLLKTLTRGEDGRYSVSLPWKENKSILPENREVAVKRLRSTTTRLQQKGMFEAYHYMFENWERENFIEKVDASHHGETVHYVPHRAVIKPESLTTPVRPVFDVSCRVRKRPSLNDLLYKGDNYIQLIPDLLLRFREKNVGFVSDIRKAFQMIGVHSSDRDTMRFLWWQSHAQEEIVEYRHARVMFGATCSPFILGAVLHHHLHGLPENELELGKTLFKTFYVDNCVHSVNTEFEYHQFREKSVEILKRAGMDLRMWVSSVDAPTDENQKHSVLGLQWDRSNDTLFVNVAGIVVPEKMSKRTILSVMQRVYDPLGFISPAILPLKLLLQQAWLTKLKWDEPLPRNMTQEFLKWCEEIKHLGEISVPRLMTSGVSNRDHWSLNLFTDACIRSYAAVVYLRVETEEDINVHFVIAKSRVAPTKPVTIPRLELMGCFIGARLLNFVRLALNIPDVRVNCWSDSTTALAWIRREDQWGTFVANRTVDIRKLTSPACWRHVAGSENPADLFSRGCYPSHLTKSTWREGPLWLKQPEFLWPRDDGEVNEDEVAVDRKKIVVHEASYLVITESVRNNRRFTSLVRIVGWVRVYLYNYLVKLPEKRRRGDLNEKEIKRSELMLIKSIQRNAFPRESRDTLKSLELFEDDWGILHVKTRLTYRDDLNEFKFPILLPNKNDIVKQMIMDVHITLCHGGTGMIVGELRKRFWILKCRRTVKSVLARCVRCRKFSSKNIVPAPAPLPIHRVKDAEVFEVTGVDLAGPLFLKNGNEAWLVIFTCAVYRAVHFELVNSLSTRCFINSLGRFIQKYRRPAVIYSDNGTNFRGADNLFRSLDWTSIQDTEKLGRIEWKFNPVASAWWGGWWERLIRTAKDLLKRTVGKGTLNWKELESVIVTVADVMNHRPLTYISEDVMDLEPLSPATFLHPYGNVQFPEKNLTESEKLRFRVKYVQTLRDELKGRFRREYLAMLVNNNAKKPSRDLIPGEMVWVGRDDRKRIDWPLGRVIELFRGKDGVCRVAKVVTEKRIIDRSVQRLFPLEADASRTMESDVRVKAVKTRAGRMVKIPDKFIP